MREKITSLHYNLPNGFDHRSYASDGKNNAREDATHQQKYYVTLHQQKSEVG